MPDIMASFIDLLLTQFRLPADKENDQDAFYQDYRDALTYCNEDGELVPYDDETLQRAAKKIKAERIGSRTIPMPGECVVVCRDVRNQMLLERVRVDMEQRPRQKPLRAPFVDQKANPTHEWRDNPTELWTESHRANADKAMRTAAGRKAVDEGWGWAFWDFCRENQRFPNEKEASIIKRRSLANDARIDERNAAHEAAGGRLTPEVLACLKMRKEVKEKFRKLAYG